MRYQADVCLSLPFKLTFFVLVDGWSLVAGGLRGPDEAGGDFHSAVIASQRIAQMRAR